MKDAKTHFTNKCNIKNGACLFFRSWCCLLLIVLTQSMVTSLWSIGQSSWWSKIIKTNRQKINLPIFLKASAPLCRDSCNDLCKNGIKNIKMFGLTWKIVFLLVQNMIFYFSTVWANDFWPTSWLTSFSKGSSYLLSVNYEFRNTFTDFGYLTVYQSYWFHIQ